MYDYLIVGKGLFGSAAARYLSQVSDSVCIVGPDEPADWSSHQGVFASHYDEARIASFTGPDEVWTQLDQASMAQYRELEESSGVRFYTDSGRLSVTLPGELNSYPYLENNAARTQTYSASNLPDRFPLHFPDDYEVVFEEAPSGYINPRQMIRAQLAVATQQNTHVINQRVTSVQNRTSYVDVAMANGETVQAEKVLLATGSFTNCYDLVLRKLALWNQALTVLLAQVSSSEAERLRELPPVNYKIEQSTLSHIYFLPPLRYPDGRFYVKMGCSFPVEQGLPDLEALRNWFANGGDKTYVQEMQKALLAILPDLHVTGWKLKPCVVCFTPSGKPIIDILDSRRIYVAVGGNGGSAHPSDAIGHLAADLMVHDRWISDLSPEPFQIQFADEWQEWMAAPTTLW